jgi:hypothetical protein
MLYDGMCSIQSWARETIYAKRVLLTEDEVRRLISEMSEGEVFDSYVFEAVAYRRVLLERLIYEKGDQVLTFVLELDNSSSVSLS